jgi:hypothetical protein
MDYPLSRAAELGLSAGKFTDGVPGVSPASVDPSQTYNDIIDEILAVQVAGGVAKDEFTRTQLRDSIIKLIESRVGDYSLDTGAANTYVVAMNPVIVGYSGVIEGTFRVAHACTGASTLNAGGGALPLKRNDGSPTQDGDMPLNSLVSWQLDPVANVFLLKAMVPSQTSGRLLRTVIFTANGTWNAGAGTTTVEVEVVGGGGGGSGTPATGAGEFGAGTGGGGGGYAWKRIVGVASPTSVTVGAAGLGGAGVLGNVGGTSSFGAYCSATGGIAGASSGKSTVGTAAEGVAGGTATGGDLNEPGGGSQQCFTQVAGGIGSGLGSNGGDSKHGFGGESGYNRGGASGHGRGAGGGGTYLGASSGAVTGGDGTAGIVIVREFA